MDTLSVAVLLLLAFMAWGSGITWLFVGAMILFVITVRSFGLIALVLGGIGAIYFLHLQQHWFIIAAGITGLAILIASRKEKAGSEAYSPELMRLLGGGA